MIGSKQDSLISESRRRRRSGYVPYRHDASDVELHPSRIGGRELADDPVARRGAVRAVADQARAIGELDDRPNLMKSGHLGVPPNPRKAGEIGKTVLVP